jgi:hypothetical protein
MFISTTSAVAVPADVAYSQEVIEGRTPTADRLELEWLNCEPVDQFAKGHLVCQVPQGVGVWPPQQVVYVMEVRRQKWLGLLTDPDLAPSSRSALTQDAGVSPRVNQWIYDPALIGAVLDHWNMRD